MVEILCFHNQNEHLPSLMLEIRRNDQIKLNFSQNGNVVAECAQQLTMNPLSRKFRKIEPPPIKGEFCLNFFGEKLMDDRREIIQ